jgi:hypothetical protein
MLQISGTVELGDIIAYLAGLAVILLNHLLLLRRHLRPRNEK